jgi:hypothetical protein
VGIILCLQRVSSNGNPELQSNSGFTKQDEKTFEKPNESCAVAGSDFDLGAIL